MLTGCCVAGIYNEVLSTIFTTETQSSGNLHLSAATTVTITSSNSMDARNYPSISFEWCRHHFNVHMRIEVMSDGISNEMVRLNSERPLFGFK